MNGEKGGLSIGIADANDWFEWNHSVTCNRLTKELGCCDEPFVDVDAENELMLISSF